MSITVDAIYEQGVFRPLEPLTLDEGQCFSLTLADRYDLQEQAPDPQHVAELLQNLALLHEPLGEPEFGSIDHDHYLYGAPKQSERTKI